MSDPYGCIGCLVKRELAASHRNQDLAVHYVVVDEYDPDCKVYQVHNVSDPSEKFCVLLQDIKIEITPVFTPPISNPSEYEVVDNLDMKNIPSGSVIDFSQCSKPTIRGGKLFVRGSYGFIGTSTEDSVDGLCLHTLLMGCVYVGAQSDDEIIAFDRIVFDVEQGSHNVICLRGTIVFKGCYFQGRSGLKVGSGNAPVSVYLVGCTFADGGDCSVVIESNALVTMINTAMNGSKVGVSVKDGGTFTAHHCNLSYYSFGVVTSGENATAHLTHCTLDNHGMCAIFANSGKITLLKCKVIDGLGCGIGLGGLGQVRAVLKECGVSGPACAVKLIGDVDLKSSGLTIIDCNVGIVATSTCSGDVWFTSNRFVDCDIHVANLSNGDRCKLLWNGILNFCQQQRLEQVQQTTPLGTASSALAARWSLKVRRLFTHSDFDTSLQQQARCGGCGTVEPSHRAFKNCAQCKQECYCSVQCQRSHWKKHQKLCEISDTWTRELYVLGYVACIFAKRGLMGKRESILPSWVNGHKSLTNCCCFCSSCNCCSCLCASLLLLFTAFIVAIAAKCTEKMTRV